MFNSQVISKIWHWSKRFGRASKKRSPECLEIPDEGSLVLVTGVSGYLGTHVVDRLVKEGYRVRGTVRSAKVAVNKEAFSVYGNSVEIIAMDDLAGGSYPNAFKGVSAVVHLAAPLVGRAASAEEAISVAVDGSLNIMKQAEQAGIKNISYISSIVAHSLGFMKGDYSPVTDDQWVPISKEAVLNDKTADGYTIYVAEKVLSERAVWEFADQHPHVEITTVSPPFFYGPFAPAYRNPDASIAALSTMGFVWNFIHPERPAASTSFVDVRDVARALVAALKAPPTSQVGRKRILISSEWVSPSAFVELIAKERPALVDRLSEAMKTAPGGVKSVIDNKRLKEVLGLEVTPWKKTILDAVDDLIRLENEWKSRGLTPK